MRTGPVSFRGGGVWGQLPKYFLHWLPENQVVLPEYYMLFPQKNGYLKNSRWGAAQPPPPQAPPRRPIPRALCFANVSHNLFNCNLK